jgi:nicotinate-nucleotide adenylyltransferase
MKIGIFGGTFDPPHWAHMILAEWVRTESKLDKVWLMPVLSPPHKQDSEITDPETRFEMVSLACGEDEFIRPSALDLRHRRRPSYTFDLLNELKRKYRTDKFSLIIGADAILEFSTWHRWQELLLKFEVIGLLRPGKNLFNAGKRVLSKIKILSTPLLEISSTEIRKRVMRGKSIRFMVSFEVEKFIYEKQLYRK